MEPLRMTLTRSNNTVIEDTMAGGSPVFTDEPLHNLIILMDDDVWAEIGSPLTITVEVSSSADASVAAS